jgi:hypothetical protein
MINATRPKESPASLQSQEIRDYLEALANHKENPVQYPKPEKPPLYRHKDVLEAFDSCFFSKCYLTEQKFENSWAMDIDHFVPKNEKPEWVCEWSNLYPADHKANMMKPRRMPEGGYLDPCDDNDDVEYEILYALSIDGEKPAFKARDNTNQKAVNTAGLLEHLHNGDDEDSKKNTTHLRFLIRKKYIEILNAILEWRAAKDEQDKFQAETEIKRLLSRRASFTALIRSVPAVRRDIPVEFLD